MAQYRPAKVEKSLLRRYSNLQPLIPRYNRDSSQGSIHIYRVVD